MAKYVDENNLARFWDNIQDQIGSASQEQVNAWLDAHPEATTTVQDNSLDGSLKLIDGTVPDSKLVQTGGVLESLQSFKDGTFDYETVTSENLLNINDPDVEHGKYMTNTGAVFTSSSYAISGYIPVEEGKSYTFQTSATTITNRSIQSFRFLTAYDADKNIVSSAGGENVRPYVVPNGIAYIRFSQYDVYFASNTWPAVVESAELTPYSEYFDPYTKYTLKASAANDAHTRAILTEYIPSGLRYKFTIDHGYWNGTIDIQDLADYVISFRGTIGTFAGVTVSRGYGAYLGGYVMLSATEVRVYIGDAQNVLTASHGLTLTDYVGIVLTARRNNTATITVYTNGGSYTSSNFSWDVRKGVLSAGGTNTVLTDCELTYWCKGYASDTQVYGDSYISPAHTDRWSSYLIAAGYNDFLLNAYSGRNSATALASLKQVLQSSNPKRIVWTLGMNDGDDGGVVDASWKSCVEEVMAICQERGIELILATIPNVPTVDNTAKNAYVRASGYRYIDFAAAVGAVSDTTWYDGMLSSDNVHPSVQGAIALYTQAISDVPELMK